MPFAILVDSAVIRQS
jgi:hypothetical protein